MIGVNFGVMTTTNCCSMKPLTSIHEAGVVELPPWQLNERSPPLILHGKRATKLDSFQSTCAACSLTMDMYVATDSV